MEFNMTETLKEFLDRLFKAQLENKMVIIGYDSSDDSYSTSQATKIMSYKCNNNWLEIFGDHEKTHTIHIDNITKDGEFDFYINSQAGRFSVIFV